MESLFTFFETNLILKTALFSFGWQVGTMLYNRYFKKPE